MTGCPARPSRRGAQPSWRPTRRRATAAQQPLQICTQAVHVGASAQPFLTVDWFLISGPASQPEVCSASRRGAIPGSVSGSGLRWQTQTQHRPPRAPALLRSFTSWSGLGGRSRKSRVQHRWRAVLIRCSGLPQVVVARPQPLRASEPWPFSNALSMESNLQLARNASARCLYDFRRPSAFSVP